MEAKLPISIRDTPPGKGATRLTALRAGGGTDGLHTGGAWLYQGKVWKPLDGRPFMNADYHMPTREEEALEALQRNPLFPKNWEIKESNGRRFIVRDQVATFPGGSLKLFLKDLQFIEKHIKAANDAGWQINDDIVIGRDRTSRLFVVDMSAAHKMSGGTGATRANDNDHISKLYKLAGVPEIPALRHIGVEFHSQIFFKGKNPGHKGAKYFYYTRRKLEEKDWAAIKGINPSEYLAEITPHLRAEDKQALAKFPSWVATKSKLSDSQMRQFDLQLAYESRL